MLTLYHAPRSRSSRMIWLLEELGVPYQIRQVSIRRMDRSADGAADRMIGARDPANVHPHGKVPAIVHDDVTIFESAAIVLYLTDTFAEPGIGPRTGDPQRGAYLTWLAYCAA